jgi:hypothetical protein
VPDDLIKLWLGHSQNLIDLYAAQLRYDETYRKGWCERAVREGWANWAINWRCRFARLSLRKTFLKQDLEMVAGVRFELTTFGLCALSPEPAEYNRQYFVFLAAGSAAELLTYGSYDEEAARSDSCVSARDGLLSM